MNANDVVVKTAQGFDELKTRARKLPPRLRTMLIMIDGSMRAGQLQKAAETLGVPNGFLDDLLAQGLIAVEAAPAPVSATSAAVAPKADAPDRFRAAQRFMNDTVVSALGFRAMFFTLKLEKCSTVADLSALIGDFEKAITKGNGADAARVLAGKARDMIGSTP